MTAFAAFMGKPYAPRARGPDAFDCWGLVLALRRELGLCVPPDLAPEAMTADEQARLTEGAMQAWPQVAPRHGCIAYVPGLLHGGVVVFGRVVHATERAGVVAWPLGRWRMVYPHSEFYECRT